MKIAQIAKNSSTNVLITLFAVSVIAAMVSIELHAESSKPTWSNSLVVDVRTENEFNEKHHPDSINVPLSEIQKGNIDAFKNTDKEFIVVVCRTGQRAATAIKYLENQNLKAKLENYSSFEYLSTLEK
ncbi:MAG: rhodanese-like domain-containing protein [Methylacidiphilales bacterium]|nr:rhodanese-like domain-containing protein [Candidatus Methylacidiphilales bacterium]